MFYEAGASALRDYHPLPPHTFTRPSGGRASRTPSTCGYGPSMLRASLLALCLTTAAGQLRGARPLGGLPRSSALQSTTDMFAFWCNTEREGSSLCQSRKRSQKLGEIQKQARSARTMR